MLQSKEITEAFGSGSVWSLVWRFCTGSC